MLSLPPQHGGAKLPLGRLTGVAWRTATEQGFAAQPVDSQAHTPATAPAFLSFCRLGASRDAAGASCSN